MAYTLLFIIIAFILLIFRNKKDHWGKFRTGSYSTDNYSCDKIKPGIINTQQKNYYTDSNGYYRFLDSDILVHRYIASKKIGRKLTSDEVVHHIDGNKKNNRPNNLKVCNREEHSYIHNQNFKIYGSWNQPELDYVKPYRHFESY